MRGHAEVWFDAFTNMDWGGLSGPFVQCLCGASGQPTDLETCDLGLMSWSWPCPRCDTVYRASGIAQSHALPDPVFSIEVPADIRMRLVPESPGPAFEGEVENPDLEMQRIQASMEQFMEKGPRAFSEYHASATPEHPAHPDAEGTR